MHRICAPRNLGSGMSLIGILMSLGTAVGAHHIAGGGWPGLNVAAALAVINVILVALAQRAPSKLSAFLVMMLGAQFLDHAIMSMSHTSASMCGHEQTRCAIPAPMMMNTHAMVIAHVTATALSTWMAYLVMRLLRSLSEFFARLFTRTAIKTPILLAPRAPVFITQTVRGIHHVIRAPRRGPPTEPAFCA